MVSLRSSSRRPGLAGSGEPSSSATKGVSIQSDENGPAPRSALGDIKNVVASGETSGLRRRPLTDRNMLASFGISAQKESTGSSGSRIGGQDVPQKSTSRPAQLSRLTSNKTSMGISRTGASASASRQARPSKSHDLERFSHIHLPTLTNSLRSEERASKDASLSHQIETAARRSAKAMPSDESLKRLYPPIRNDDLDDLEYFDHTITHTAQTAHADRKQRATESEPGETNSHASSDKENRPPPTVRLGTYAGDRPGTRARVGVLTSTIAVQPTHSTPIRRSGKSIDAEEADSDINLDEVFLGDSDRSSDVDSPGAARKVAPPTASEQRLLEYQDRGVSKVRAWKAAGHDRVDCDDARQSSPMLERDAEADSAVSWPTADDHAGMDTLHRSSDAGDITSDEFGFLRAGRKMLERTTLKAADFLDLGGGLSHRSSAEAESQIYIDIPTDPFNTSDDRRLAEQAFGLMSSPGAPHAQHGRIVTSSEPEDRVDLQRQEAPLAGNKPDVEVETENVEYEASPDGVTEPDASVRRSHGVSTKRKSDACVAQDDDDDVLESSAPLRGSSMRQTRGQAATAKTKSKTRKTKKAMTGVPLKRNEKQEQAMLERLAAEESSSASSFSAVASPAKASTSGTSAKKMRMDEALGLLPRRKSKIVATVKKGNKAAKGRGIKATRAARSKPAKDGKGRKDDSDARSTSQKGKARAAGQLNVVDDEEAEDPERIQRIKQLRAVDEYVLECEVVL